MLILIFEHAAIHCNHALLYLIAPRPKKTHALYRKHLSVIKIEAQKRIKALIDTLYAVKC